MKSNLAALCSWASSLNFRLTPETEFASSRSNKDLPMVLLQFASKSKWKNLTLQWWGLSNSLSLGALENCIQVCVIWVLWTFPSPKMSSAYPKNCWNPSTHIFPTDLSSDVCSRWFLGWNGFLGWLFMALGKVPCRHPFSCWFNHIMLPGVRTYTLAHQVTRQISNFLARPWYFNPHKSG